MPEWTRVERSARRGVGESLFRVARLLGWDGPTLLVVPDRPRLLAEVARLAARSGLAVEVTTFAAWASRVVRAAGVAELPTDPARERTLLDDAIAAGRPHLKRFARLAATRNFSDALRRTRDELRGVAEIPPATDALAEVAALLKHRDDQPAARSRRDRVGLIDLAADRLQSLSRPYLWLAGFDRLDAAEQRLLRAAWPLLKGLAVELDPSAGLDLPWTGPSKLITLDPPNGQSPAEGEGLDLIEAPGSAGEAEMVARSVREALAAGTPPERVGIVRRDWFRDFDLWAGRFADHGLTLRGPEATPLARVPAVARLLDALRTPDNDFTFDALGRLLRANFFRPTFAARELAAKAEALLRMLGESKGRAAVIRACQVWADEPPEALEDEQAEEGLRRRKTRFAKECGGFFERVLGLWDALDKARTVGDALDWLDGFTSAIGWRDWLAGPDSLAFLAAWDAALSTWRRASGDAATTPDRFRRDLEHVLLANPAPPDGADGRPVIRMDAPEAWDGLRAEHLFLTGLDEGVFPRPASPGGLLDESDRDALRAAGVPLPTADDRAAAEERLFRRLLDSPSDRLTLSRVGFDGRGQPTLQAAAWRDLLGRLEAAPPKRSRRMPLEGYWSDPPLSASHARHLAALALFGTSPRALDPGDRPHRLRLMALARQSATAFTAHDGWLADAGLGGLMAQRFGPERVISPTTLERYVACPFSFLVRDIWRASPLERPSAGVEHSRRGSAFHRALARFHELLRDEVTTAAALVEGADAVRDKVTAEVTRALEEYRKRATTAAARKLWELEARRLERHARRYVDHWLKFLGLDQNTCPVPTYLEADFGLPGPTRPDGPPAPPVRPPLVLESADGSVAVRLGGRIDRVDVALTPAGPRFWVIDYKTGRATNYSANDLLRHEKLQLPLYALAVQRLFFEAGEPHPQGMAYWLVTDGGLKAMLPAKRQADWEQAGAGWDKFARELTAKVLGVVAAIRAGHFPLRPNGEKPCERCEASGVCRIGGARNAVARRELVTIEVLSRT